MFSDFSNQFFRYRISDILGYPKKNFGFVMKPRLEYDTENHTEKCNHTENLQNHTEKLYKR